IRQEQIEEHGGGLGVRDVGLLQSALQRPVNIAIYEPPTHVNAARLAAAYAFGIVTNHPFIDGNKRTGFVVLELFLRLNGWELTAEDSDCIYIMLQLAEGKLTEEDLTD